MPRKKPTQPDKTFNNIVEIFDTLVQTLESEYNLPLPTAEQGVIVKTFRISNAGDVSDAMLELAFGTKFVEMKKKKPGQKGFLEHDRELVLRAREIMKTKKITLDQARWETVPEAYRRAEDVTDESIYERLKDVHEMMLQEDKKAEKADDDMEEIIQDSITYGPDDDLRYDMFTIDMDLINPWLRRNKGYLIRYLEGLQ